MFLYKPTPNSIYQLPIFDTDSLIAGRNLRDFIDTYIANNGHSVTKERLQKELDAYLKAIIDDAYETFDIVADGIIEAIKKEV